MNVWSVLIQFAILCVSVGILSALKDLIHNTVNASIENAKSHKSINQHFMELSERVKKLEHISKDTLDIMYEKKFSADKPKKKKTPG